MERGHTDLDQVTQTWSHSEAFWRYFAYLRYAAWGYGTKTVALVTKQNKPFAIMAQNLKTHFKTPGIIRIKLLQLLGGSITLVTLRVLLYAGNMATHAASHRECVYRSRLKLLQ